MRAIAILVGALMIAAGLLAGCLALYIWNGDSGAPGPWSQIAGCSVAAAALIAGGVGSIVYGARLRQS